MVDGDTVHLGNGLFVAEELGPSAGTFVKEAIHVAHSGIEGSQTSNTRMKSCRYNGKRSALATTGNTYVLAIELGERTEVVYRTHTTGIYILILIGIRVVQVGVHIVAVLLVQFLVLLYTLIGKKSVYLDVE